MVKGEDLIIRVRDDYKHFNIMEYYQDVGGGPEETELAIIMNEAKSIKHAVYDYIRGE